jgi:ethanolamine ammonia-lyase small subunit
MNDQKPLMLDDPWQALQRFTAARIALGRAGASLPTRAQLEFQLAHARARDAVHTPLDTAALETDLGAAGLETLTVDSAALDRHQYLQRPDLGRKLSNASRVRAGEFAVALQADVPDIVFVIADGLSALAIQRNAVAFTTTMLPLLSADNWYPAPVVIVRQGRVAIGDEIGALFKTRAVVMLIGERPGLSSPDSMGIYLTWAPHAGVTTDAGRNCISNVRDGGLSHAEAAHRLKYLLNEARARQLSGVALKDETEAAPLQIESDRNFLIMD